MDSDIKIRCGSDDGFSLAANQHAEAFHLLNAQGLGQIADKATLKKAEQVAEALLADNRLVDELLGP